MVLSIRRTDSGWIGIIGISNDPHFKDFLDPRVSRRKPSEGQALLARHARVRPMRLGRVLIGPLRRVALLTLFLAGLTVFSVGVTGTSGTVSHTASAQSTGSDLARISVAPASAPAEPVGASVTYYISASNFSTFNGYDISVRTDPNVLIPKTITVIDPYWQDFGPLINCVNGRGYICVPTDGPGVAHVGAVLVGCYDVGSRILFSITYTVMGAGQSHTYVTPFNDRVAAPHAIYLPHSTVSGFY